MTKNYLKNSISRVVLSYKFNLLAGTASIISLIGWALDTFVTWTGINGVIGWMASAVILILFIMTFMALIFFVRKHSQLELQKEQNTKLVKSQQLNTQIFYHLKSAIGRLKKLECEVLSSISKLQTKGEVEKYIESKEKDAANIFKQFAAKAVNNAYKQAEIYFLSKDLPVSSLRLTVKGLVSNKDSELKDWLVKTSVRDSNTWQHLDNDEHQAYKNRDHRLGDNTDFWEIVDNNKPMFVANNLKELAGKYKNSSPNWSEDYNASFVVPIVTNHNDSWIYYGFVALDSMNSDNQDLFKESKEDELYQVLKGLAESLAIWHMVYNSYIDNVFAEFCALKDQLAQEAVGQQERTNDRK
ncbi:hypothetical protein G6355_18490 [Vibrio cholerae]|uniref:hypothetical protein n=1 Tax=Vibrio cholerae TaxID=666 RepID=UPI0011AB8472|nr:hypothetical protein [Vibrio cholerae]EHS4950271.1 hypothetical protein [Vibrio cholerae]EJL6666571.1 hypothetical protein [Vibrio cholerae]TYW39963.1 hypothetical protein FY553_18775 [Vibrio cholerae]HEG4440223.1 hypothetical protein [Vibrio cholerae]